MEIKINRTRYIVVRDDGSIFCGLARDYQFKKLNEIGDTALKTYSSAKKAKSSFLQSWGCSSEEDFLSGRYKIVEVTESLIEA